MLRRPALLFLLLTACAAESTGSPHRTEVTDPADLVDLVDPVDLADLASPDVADLISPDASPDVADLTPDADPGPTPEQLEAIHLALDVFIDSRFEAPAGATEALAAQIRAAHLTLADVEALLRAGRARYPSAPPQEPGYAGAYHYDETQPDGFYFEPHFAAVDLDCYHYDYSTRYYVYVPSNYTPERAWGLVFVGHGGNSSMSADRARRYAEYYLDDYYEPLGEDLGAIVVAPATERGWGAVGNSILFSTLARVSRDYHIDPDRLYVTGHSMGGHLSWRTALTFSDRFGAVSPQSGGYDSWATTNALANVYGIPGFTTYGKDEPYNLNATNNLLAAWLDAHNFPWVTVEKDPGGHEVFYDELPRIAAFFDANPRDLYRDTVFFRGAGAMRHGDETNAAWDPPTEAIDPDRPIRWNLRNWLEVTPRPESDDTLAFFAINRGGNRIEITSQGIRHLRVMVHPRMVDMSHKVTIVVNGQVLHDALISENLEFLLDHVRELDDRGRIFYGYVDLEVATDVTVDDPVYPELPGR